MEQYRRYTRWLKRIAVFLVITIQKRESALGRARVRTLLAEKRHVVEGIRDALLAREELIGDEIEALMARARRARAARGPRRRPRRKRPVMLP